MKKIIMAAAIACVAAFANAATVGWSLGGASANAGDTYKFFVIGQNGVTSIDAMTALLVDGTDVSPTFHVRLDGELFSRRNAA